MTRYQRHFFHQFSQRRMTRVSKHDRPHGARPTDHVAYLTLDDAPVDVPSDLGNVHVDSHTGVRASRGGGEEAETLEVYQNGSPSRGTRRVLRPPLHGRNISDPPCGDVHGTPGRSAPLHKTYSRGTLCCCEVNALSRGYYASRSIESLLWSV